ncbi:hypothetical protein KEM54_001887 [Ascosphaera aggregata]|nr:hypothetical protein KEM54_001887 [Ascosphaera aggregata]
MVAADPSAPRFGGLTGQPLSVCITVVATCGFLLFGYDQGIMSGIITGSVFNNVFPPTLGDSTIQGFVTAIYEIGCLAGAVFILYLGDRLGRRRAIILGAAIMCLGVLIQVTAYKGHEAFAQFIIGRIITGVGNGINTSTIPTYQAECSRNTNRGLLICIEGSTIAFGTLISYWIDFGASYAFTGPDDLQEFAKNHSISTSDIDVYNPPFGEDWGNNLDITWRFPIAFQVVFGLFICAGMTFLPESPRWLMSRERYEEGELVLAALAGKSVNDPQVQLQKTIVLDSIRASGGGGKSTPLSAVFSNGKTQHFRRALLGMLSQFMQQIGGCNAVIYYLPILVKDSLEKSHRFSMLIGGINMIVYAAFATASWFLIESVGRRKLFLVGTFVQCGSMVITFACMIKNGLSEKQIHANAKGAIVGLFLYIAAFGATWLSLPWLYPAEISPIKTRAKANAFSTCSNWLFNFLIVMVTPVMITNIQWGTYLFFAIVNACFIPVIWFFFPETAKRSLEEIDIIFAKGYTENISYVKAAKLLPYLTDEQVKGMSIQYGFHSDSEESGSINNAEMKRDIDD